MGASAGAIKQGRAFIEIFAEDSKLRKGLKAGLGHVKAFGSAVNRAGASLGGSITSGLRTVSKMAKIASWGAAAAAGGLILAAKKFADADRSLLSPEQAAAADAMRDSFKALSQTFFDANAAIMTKLQPAISAVIDIVRIGVKAVADWIGRNKELIDGITNWIGGMRDALSAGDLKLAGEILWAGLKVAWKAGIVEIEELWNKWGTSFQQAAIEAFYGVLQTANDVWAQMRIGIAGITSYLTEKFKDATIGAADMLTDVKVRLGLMSKEEAAGRKTMTSIAKGLASDAIGAQGASAKKGIEADRDKRSSDLAEQQRIASDEMARANQAKLDAAQAALDAQKQELQDLLTRARENAQNIPGKQPGSQQFANRVAVTASAVAARGLAGSGGNTPAEKTAKATEQTAKNTKDMLNRLGDMFDNPGMVWNA